MTYRRLLAAWLALAVAMPLNGAFRELYLKTVLPIPFADVLSAVLGAAIILALTFAIFRVPANAPTTRLFAMSGLLVVMTVAFEFTFGRIEGKSWGELVANYALWNGRLWPLVLLVLAATPFLWRGRGRARLA